MQNIEQSGDMPKLITLEGSKSQVIIKITDVADIIFYGKKLTQPKKALTEFTNADYSMLHALDRCVPFGCLDDDIPLTLNPQSARGVFSSPALEGHRDGLAWSPVFSITQVNYEETSDGQVLLIDSEDKQEKLTWQTRLILDKNDVLQVSQTIKNEASECYQVQRLANTIPLPMDSSELLTYYGRWVNEFQTQRQSLMQGGYIQENRRGRTSHQHYPALVAGNKGFGEMQGDVYGAHLAWSGNHRMQVNVKADGRRFLQAEALYFAGEIKLAKGETLSTPTLYMSYSDHGLNDMSHQFHQHVRAQILGSRLEKTRPIHLNTWEGIYFDHSPEYIMKMATTAAQMGVERFIVDDGWFKARNDDTTSLGDWFIDQNKYPQGIGELIQHVKTLGMEFGLWFEPEMVSKDSDVYRQHPEWLLEVAGYNTPTGRHQYVLDLQNQAVFDYLFERLDHFLTEYEIDYIKWDMNREVVQPGHNNRASGHQQVVKYYELVDRLTAKHPNVDIESCAAGGGRIDYEVLKRTHRFWPSDNNDPLCRQGIQKGISYFFPPEVLGTHIGAHTSHTTRRTHNINFRGLTALFGHMGLELDPVAADENEINGFVKYVELHKQYRHLLHSGRSIRLETEDNQASQALMVVDNAQAEGLVMIAQLTDQTYAQNGQLTLPYLKHDAWYELTLVDRPENFFDIVAKQPVWTQEKLVLSGEWLAHVGIAMPNLDSESAILFEIRQVSA